PRSAARGSSHALGRAGGCPTFVQAGSIGPPGVLGPTYPLEGPNQRSRGIALSPVDAVTGERGEGVVRVVPRLAHRHDGEGAHVRALVAGGERPAPERVAHGVDAPGHVVEHADADPARPEESGPGRREPATPHPSDAEG